ncbi:hypothetical protein Tco_0382014 [Tanacetum coccineum]
MDSIYGARSTTNSSSLMKPIQKSQVVLVDILDYLIENDSIVAEHGMSSKITQIPGGSSNTSEGFKNSGNFEDSGRSDEEYSEDGASFKEGENGESESYLEALSSKESVHWKKAIIEEIVSLEKNQTCSLLAGQKENLECRLEEIMYGLIQAPRLRYLKFDSFMQNDKALTWQNSTTLSDSWNEEPCSDVHQVGDEIEVEVLHSFNWPLSELITEDGFLLERVQRVLDVQRYRKLRAVALLKRRPDMCGACGATQVNPNSTIAWVEQITSFRYSGTGGPTTLKHVASCIVGREAYCSTGFEGRILGCKPNPTSIE